MFKLSIDKIAGDSMSPAIKDGSYVLSYFSIKMKLLPKKVYKLSHPQFGSIIKRLSFKDKDGNFWFEGDSKSSTSGKKIGAITKGQITGRIYLAIDSNNRIKFF
jgi:hypothetical protein